MTKETKKLVVLLSHGANDDKSTVAFNIANASLSAGLEVAVFLVSDAVQLGRDGSCDYTVVRPFKPLQELIDSFIDGGGVLATCAPCYQHRGNKAEDSVEGSRVTGAGLLVEWVAAGASTICL